MKKIDIRSDTVTVPTQNMKKAMLQSQVGDDVFGTDPTSIELERLAAELTGMEAALFCPTGTMANQLAILVHSGLQKGKEVIVGQWHHIAWDENASHAVISGVQLRTLPQDSKGEMDLDEIERTIRKVKMNMYPETACICLENTFHGTAVSMDYVKSVKNVAQKYNIPVHMDGARIWNAIYALNVDIKEITSHIDSLQFCLSKGLCCPMGSMLVGKKDFIEKARHYRKMMGGTMRQVGVVAGPGIVALKEQIKELKTDNQMAEILNKKLSELSSEILVDQYQQLSTNMLFFKFKKDEYNTNEEKVGKFIDFMKQNDILINECWEPDYKYRFVVHFYIREQQINKIVEVVDQFLKTQYQ